MVGLIIVPVRGWLGHCLSRIFAVALEPSGNIVGEGRAQSKFLNVIESLGSCEVSGG